MVQLMARNTSGQRRAVCFYPRETQLIREATGQSWQPKEHTGQECTQLEANKSKSLHTRFIHSLARTHRYCMRTCPVSVPMLCGLI
jgi:hypothetical protein